MKVSCYVAIGATLLAVGLLTACGGGGGSTGSGAVPPSSGSNAAVSTSGSSGADPVPTSPVVMSAGSTMTMAANSSVLVPPGSKVRALNGNTKVFLDSSNTVYTSVGTIIEVPSTATRPATNLVTTVAATGAVANDKTPSVSTSFAFDQTVLAGSDVDNKVPVDGTGTGAVLRGGGHMVVEPDTNNLLISDQGTLKSVTQAGVVTTVRTTRGSPLTGYVYFNGIAIDAAHNVFASGLTTPTSQATFRVGTSIWKRNVDGAVQDFALNWETATGATNLGVGGLAIDSSGNLFYADYINHQIVKFTPSGVMSVFAGTGKEGWQDGVGIAAGFLKPQDIALGANGNLFVADGFGVRKITPDGTVSTLVRTSASIIAADMKGNVFVSDFFGLKRIDSSGNVTIYPVDSGKNEIVSLAVDSSGALYMGTSGIGAQILKVTFN